MTNPPDDFDIPDGPPPDDDNGDDSPKPPETPKGPPRKKAKLVMSPSAQKVVFADTFGFTLTPTHGIIKFGVFHPESGEFVVHTQVALSPQGLVALNRSLTANLPKVSKKKGPGRSMN